MSMLPVGFGASGDYTIEESLRFNASQSSYLSWTPASAGNRKTWTWSGWVKRGKLGVHQGIFEGNSGGSNLTAASIDSSDKFNFQLYSSPTYNTVWSSSAVFRDPSAWYHIVVSIDTTQASLLNVVKLYVNGVQQTISYTDYNSPIPQNSDWFINSTNTHTIGTYNGIQNYLDGYITEVNFIDGQALDPSSFGEFDATTGVWKPVGYTGTYGTNGFFLDFRDATSATTLGYDYSGNSNNWTLNNFNTTSTSTAYCSMTDTPTPYLGGGNYAVLSPIDKTTNIIADLSNANLKFEGSTSNARTTYSTFTVNSQKWYFEVSIDFSGSSANRVGLRGANSGVCYRADGQKLENGVFTAYGATWTAGDLIGVAFDCDAQTIEFFKNNVSQGSFSYTNSVDSSNEVKAEVADGSNSLALDGTVNFGQRPFAYTPPTGFKALHTGNLPDSTIVDGSKYFDVLLHTGNGTTNAVSGASFQPDLVWTKNRGTASNHNLSNVLSGTGYGLSSSTTGAEYATNFDSFNNDGFTVSGTGAQINASGNTYVDWLWKANGTGVSNTDGSITSTVSANPTAGFSIVTYTGTGAAATIGHGLGVAPSMIIVKNRDNGTVSWVVYHKGVDATNPENYMLFLNLTNARSSSSATGWNSTAPTSSVFSVNTYNNNNQSGSDMVAYCFAEVEGYSKFGSYTGNGSADGPFVYLGFRPKYLLIKGSSLISEWYVWDSERNTYNVANVTLNPNQANAEYSGGALLIDFTANGFKVRDAVGSWNASGHTYIYMAFAEHPFKNSLAR